MKTKFFLILLIGISSLCFSQVAYKTDKNKIIKYYLIDKFNDTTLVSVTNPNIKVYCGFNIYDNKGLKVDEVNPKNFKYLILENSLGETIKLKSIPAKKKKSYCKNKNVFVDVLIENSTYDLKKGKIDLYYHEFTNHRTFDSTNEFEIPKISSPVKSKIFYLKDINGIHEVKNFKYHFKRFPEILGKQLYEKMIRSDKNEKQFLQDYLIEYNRGIDKL